MKCSTIFNFFAIVFCSVLPVVFSTISLAGQPLVINFYLNGNSCVVVKKDCLQLTSDYESSLSQQGFDLKKWQVIPNINKTEFFKLIAPDNSNVSVLSYQSEHGDSGCIYFAKVISPEKNVIQLVQFQINVCQETKD